MKKEGLKTPDEKSEAKRRREIKIRKKRMRGKSGDDLKREEEDMLKRDG